MNDFSFSVPQNIIAGRGSIAKLPEVLKQMGATRAFIISGPHLAKIGTVQSCIDRLAAVGISAAAFTDTEKNPSVETVDRATAQFKESGADCIVALGGGSPKVFYGSGRRIRTHEAPSSLRALIEINVRVRITHPQ